MLYYIAKIIMGPALACYFRRSWYLGRDKLPSHGPVVVISNHAASFLDAMLMGVMLSRPIHFFARGDIFKKKWVRSVLGKLHMMPLYSADLAKDQLHRNTESFDQGEAVLKKGGLLLIFPEGLSRQERNAMPFRKGVSRIILQTIASNPKIEISVVPIGIHYSRHEVLSDVQLTTGNVLTVGSRHRDQYTEHAARAVNELTHELEQGLREVALFVDQDERSSLLEAQLEMYDNERKGAFTYERFHGQKEICRKISNMPLEDVKGLEEKLQKYQALLERYDTSDEAVVGRRNLVAPAILLFLSLPFFLVSFVNYPPYLFGKWMADTKVTRRDFYTSVIASVSAFSYVLWLALLLLIAWWIGNGMLLLFVLAMPLLGWFGLRWYQHYKHWKSRRNLKRLPPEEAGRIMTLRNEIRSY